MLQANFFASQFVTNLCSLNVPVIFLVGYKHPSFLVKNFTSMI